MLIKFSALWKLLGLPRPSLHDPSLSSGRYQNATCKVATRRDVADARLAGLVRSREGCEDVLPGGIVEAVRVRLDRGGACDSLGPIAADVVRLAGVVRGDDLDEVGLEGEDLLDAERGVQLTAAIPVLAAVDMLELDRRERCTSAG